MTDINTRRLFDALDEGEHDNIQEMLGHIDSDLIDINTVFDDPQDPQQKSSILREALTWADGEPQHLELLLKWNTLNINTVLSGDQEEGEGVTAAHHALREQNTDALIRLLKDERFEPNLLTDDYSDTLLSYALDATSIEMLQALLDNNKFTPSEKEIIELTEIVQETSIDGDPAFKLMELLHIKFPPPSPGGEAPLSPVGEAPLHDDEQEDEQDEQEDQDEQEQEHRPTKRQKSD